MNTLALGYGITGEIRDTRTKPLLSTIEYDEHVIIPEISYKDILLYYQPIVNIQTNKIEKAEILVRSENKLFKSANSILNSLRHHHKIVEFDLMMIERACSSKIWTTMSINTLNINISYETICKTEIVSELDKILYWHDATENITLETSEIDTLGKIAASNSATAKTIQQNIKDISTYGIRLSLDGFNETATWIQMISKYNIQEVKFRLGNLELTPKLELIMQYINFICADLGIDLIVYQAEGKEVIDRLKSLDIKYIQSFDIAKPKYLIDLISN